MDLVADVKSRLAAAAARLGAIAARREAEFERQKAKHGGPMQWVGHMDEILRAVTAAVPDDPWPDLAPDFDAIADAWLAAAPAAREAMSDALSAHPSLQDGHLGYVHHAGKSLAAISDPRALRRAVAIAAMGRGGRDSRDTSVTLSDLVRAARSAGLDADGEFARVAKCADAHGNWGGSSASPREALRAVCVSVR